MGITYAAFITALQSELTGAVLVTRVSAVGEYTTSTYILATTSMTVTIDNGAGAFLSGVHDNFKSGPMKG